MGPESIYRRVRTPVVVGGRRLVVFVRETGFGRVLATDLGQALRGRDLDEDDECAVREAVRSRGADLVRGEVRATAEDEDAARAVLAVAEAVVLADALLSGRASGKGQRKGAPTPG